MIKRMLCLWALLFGLTVTAMAQKEQDFSSRFVTLYGEKHELICKTISPDMIERILSLKEVAENKQAHQLVSQLKSVRILQGGEDAQEARNLYDKALTLASKNNQRYALYHEGEDVNIYTRHHTKKLVEIVVIRLVKNEAFQMLNLTGDMSADFVDQLRQI